MTDRDPAPTTGQLRWLDARLGLFCHFGINTFHGKEWSDGTLPAASFDPTDFDARQWVETAQAGGFNYLILTAKHHDGFCLWPTQTTDYSVASSPFRGWRDGKGDVVGEVAEACREAGLNFGLYLSPWDRHEPCYPDAAAYDAFYERQLTELCTRYGELFELWFDGAGSEGRTYDWDRIMAVVDEHQPQAMVFNMGRPTIRWIGNEDGLAQDAVRLAVDRLSQSAFADGKTDAVGEMVCLPPECDVAIRRNWFWQPDDLHTLKSAEHLLGIWYRSVGLGANLLLDMGPDQRGRISDEDAGRWMEVRRELDLRFAQPMPATLEPVEGGVDLTFGKPVTLDHLWLSEVLDDGQVVDGFEVLDAAGEPVAEGRSIGRRRVLVFPERTTDRLHLRWTGPAGCLASAEAYHTGHTELPALGDKLDYDAWAAKADPK